LTLGHSSPQFLVVPYQRNSRHSKSPDQSSRAMKTGLLTAVMVSMVAADCEIQAAANGVSATCTIPEATTISEACCKGVQAGVTKMFANLDVPPNQADEQAAMQECGSVMQYMQAHTPPAGTLASGFKCTETVAGDGEIACTLSAPQDGFTATCQIPSSTTISSECCTTVQNAINDYPPAVAPPPPSVQNDIMGKCQSVMAYAQEHFNVGPLFSTAMSKALPAGLSCTEANGLSHSVLDAILLVSGSKKTNLVSGSKTYSKAASLPSAAISVVAGAVGGAAAVVAAVVALTIYRRKQQVVAADYAALLA